MLFPQMIGVAPVFSASPVSNDVFGRAPADRQVLCADPVQTRAAPLRQFSAGKENGSRLATEQACAVSQIFPPLGRPVAVMQKEYHSDRGPASGANPRRPVAASEAAIPS
jgi:hypothetical protein